MNWLLDDTISTADFTQLHLTVR